MTHLHFTLEKKLIQSIINKTVEDDLSKTILTTVFNQLVKEHCIISESYHIAIAITGNGRSDEILVYLFDYLKQCELNRSQLVISD